MDKNMGIPLPAVIVRKESCCLCKDQQAPESLDDLIDEIFDRGSE